MKHTCHAENCTTEVKPEFLMCGKHWRMVPNKLKLNVLKTYRPGQCDDKNPSQEWVAAAKAAIQAVRDKDGFTRGT